MKEQLLFPWFRDLPAVHALWFRWANGAEYADKRYWFYPFKDRLLKARGVPDGVDVQEVVRRCWGCRDGIWTSEWGDHSDVCWYCGGTGVFRRDRIVLSRWILSGDVYHCLEPRADVETARPRNRIEGYVKHAPVPARLGRGSLEKLLLRYEPRTWWRYQKHRLRHALHCHSSVAPWPVRLALEMREAWRDNCREPDDIPF